MRLRDHVTLNFNNIVSTAAVFLDIEEAFDTTWHTGLLYNLSKLKFSDNLIKLINLFLSVRKFRVSVEGEMSTRRYMEAECHQVPSCPPHNIAGILMIPQAIGVHLSLSLSLPLSLRMITVCMRQTATRVI
jgi:hypothetical protein